LLAAEMATEVGVDAVTPWQAQRSIVRIRPERAAKTQAKWQAKLRAAAQQSRRAFIPGLHPVVQGSALAQLHAPQEGQHLVVLHEDGQDDLDGIVDALPEATSCVHLAVGPEGGITDEELAAVEQAGGSVVKLGPHVMRASTAGPVGIALLNHLLKLLLSAGVTRRIDPTKIDLRGREHVDWCYRRPYFGVPLTEPTESPRISQTITFTSLSDMVQTFGAQDMLLRV